MSNKVGTRANTEPPFMPHCSRCGAPELEETIPITDLCALCVAEDEERVASEEARG